MRTFRGACLTLLASSAFAACSASSPDAMAPGDAFTVSLTASPTSVSGVGPITLTAAPQGADVRAVEFYVRHVGVDTASLLARDTLPPYVATRDVSTLGDNGNWEFTAKAFDAQGHVAASPSVTAVVNIVDNRPLAATFTASQSRITTPGHFTFTVNSNKLLASAAVYHGDTKIAELATPQNPAVLTVNATASDNGSNSYVVKAVDGSGAVVASTPMSVVVDIRWTIFDQQVNPPNGSGSIIADMFVTTANNIYVAGTTRTLDAYLTKYDAAGKQLWWREFGGPDYESTYSVSVDPSGQVYVTGAVGYPNQPFHGDCWVTVYDGSGALLQTRIIHKSPISTGACRAATDNAGNLYVLGVTSDPAEDFLTKYDRDGTELWTQHFTGSPINNDDPSCIAVDPSGAVYVGGSTDGSFDGAPPRGAGRDVWVLKFDTDGNRRWATQYGVAGFLTWCQRLAADPMGGVYVGSATDAEDRYTSAADAVVMRIDANGAIAWVKKFDSGGQDAGEGVAADQTGVYLVGHIALGDTSHFFTEPTQDPRGGGFLMKLSRDGNVLFTRLLTAYLISDAVAPNGDVLVAGSRMLARHHDPTP